MVDVLNTRGTAMARRSLAFALLMASLDTSMVNASLPVLTHTFGASFQEAQWIVLANLLAVTSFTVSAGRAGDVLGRRRLLLIAIGLFTSMSAICAVAPSLWWLVLARAAQGVCAGTMMALAVALIGDLFPKGAAGRAMGQLAAMSAIGTTLGPTVAGALSHAGPAAIFLVNVPLGLAALALSMRYLPRTAPRALRATSFDTAGVLLLALTLAAYALAMTRGTGGWSSVNSVLLVAAVSGAALFAFTQIRTASPLLPVDMFRDLALTVGLATNAAVTTVVMATLIVGPFYLSRALGLASGHVGLILSIGPAAAALTATLAGRIAERQGAPRTVMAGLVAMAGGTVALASLPSSLGVSAYALPLVLVTSGYATFQAANNTAVMAGVGEARRGVVAGLLNLSRNLGLITGASVMGAVFVHATGTSDLVSAPPEAVATGMRATLGVAALLVTSALAVTAFSVVHARRRFPLPSSARNTLA